MSDFDRRTLEIGLVCGQCGGGLTYDAKTDKAKAIGFPSAYAVRVDLSVHPCNICVNQKRQAIDALIDKMLLSSARKEPEK